MSDGAKYPRVGTGVLVRKGDLILLAQRKGGNADWESGEARVTEPEKFYAVQWCALNQLPEPLYRPTRNFLENGYNPFTI